MSADAPVLPELLLVADEQFESILFGQVLATAASLALGAKNWGGSDIGFPSGLGGSFL